MTNELNFKELYEVTLKSTYSTEIGGTSIVPGETIALFDNIQIANFQEIKSFTSANGGFDNRAHIIWESTKEIKVSFAQGTFSKSQLALMYNSHLLKDQGQEIIVLNERKICESDEQGKITINREICDPIFVYEADTGKKILDWSRNGNIIYLDQQYKEVIIDYSYNYNNGFTIMTVGKPLINGFLSLVGKMKVKDDTTGKVVTGIIKIPKLRLMSDLSIRVGSDAIPQIGRIDAVAVPEGVRGQTKIMEIIFLNDDIDADM